MGSRYRLFMEWMNTCFIDTMSAYKLDLVYLMELSVAMAVFSLSVVNGVTDVFILV